MVNRSWGPRGFEAPLRRLSRLGVVPRLIVDIGASNGSWTRQCMPIFPDARYFLVDPLHENLRDLEALKSENPNVDYWQGALGAAPGRMSFHVHGDQSSFYPSEYSRQAGQERSVEIRTLDSFLGNEFGASRPDMIKMDVQGYELEILKGGEEAVAQAEILLLEVLFRRTYEGSPLAHDVISAVGARNFRIYDICEYGQRPGDRELFHSDILFVKDGSKAFAFEGYT